MNSNPRITTYVSSTKDENSARKIVADFRANESATLHWVLCKYIECPIVRDEPDFIHILFNDHAHLIEEMFDWMLTPQAIARRKKIKSNMDFFPFRCKQFIKDNIYFYESLYLFARLNKMPIASWFKFLRRQNFQNETVLTALGYFGEVMVPFAKYEFPISVEQGQLGKNEFQNETIGIMKILSPELISQILTYSHYEPIFQFIKTAVLVSIEDPNDYEICRQTMHSLLLIPQSQLFKGLNQLNESALHEVHNKIELLESICQSFKELIANIEPNSDLQPRTEYFISIIIESKIISYAAHQITQSNACNPQPKEKSKTGDLSFSQQFSHKNPLPNPPMSSSQGKIASPKHDAITFYDEYEEEQLMQIMLRLLSSSVQIFIRIPKTVAVEGEAQILKRGRAGNYAALILNFHDQMQVVLDHLEKMTKMVYNQPQSGVLTPFVSIPFSSGQKIKAISFMKYQFIKLLHYCLILIQCPQNFQAKIEKLNSLRKLKSITVLPFELKIQKLHIIEIVEKYLSKNRWNNIVHHVLEKICHSLIICSYQYLRKNIEKSLNKKPKQNFLSFLIENFTQRHYIFLNTFKFTTQGNLQSIYNISKDLAYTLNSTNQLVILLNEFEPWKKFILNDLKLYEEKTYPNGIQTQETRGSEESTTANTLGLKVDEVDSIRKLLQNIAETKKWPTKIIKNKMFSKSGIIRNSDSKLDQQNEPLSKSNQFYYLNKKYEYKKEPRKKTLDEILKKRVEYSIEFEGEQEIQEPNVEGIWVREQLSREKLSKEKAETKEEMRGEAYNLFKSYSVRRQH